MIARARQIAIHATAVGIVLGTLAVVAPSAAWAEWYVAPQFGVNFAESLKQGRGTGTAEGAEVVDLDLKNSYTFGGKLGFYPGNQAFGLEVDALHSNPHIKSFSDLPGINVRMTNIGIHLLLRYPGKTYQPYVGFGPAIMVSRLASSSLNQRDTNVDVGVNVLVGLRAFVTPYIAMFTEYKYTSGTPRYTDFFAANTGFQADYQAQQLVVGVSYHF